MFGILLLSKKKNHIFKFSIRKIARQYRTTKIRGTSSCIRDYVNIFKNTCLDFEMSIEKMTTACFFIRSSQVQGGSHGKLAQNELWNGFIHLVIYLFTIKEIINIDYETITIIKDSAEKSYAHSRKVQILYPTKHLTELTSINMPHVCTQNTTRLKGGLQRAHLKTQHSGFDFSLIKNKFGIQIIFWSSLYSAPCGQKSSVLSSQRLA